MPVLNYTTQIAAEKSISEIQKKLVKAGATAILCEYENQVPCHLSFRLTTEHGVLPFRLPANVDKAFQIIKSDKNIRRGYKTQDQAARVAWRVLKDWVEAQIAIIEIGMVKVEQVFLPYLQTNDGRTIYDRFASGGFNQLTDQSKG